MISLKRKQSGFTIVELLIVIVVIGILAALVITTFSGIQKKARDSERQTDINATHGQIEAYFAQQGYYPTLTNLQTDSWVQANLKGLDVKSLQAPNTSSNSIVGTGAAITNYQYAVTPSGCDNAAAATYCTGYTLTANQENSTTPYTKSALN